LVSRKQLITNQLACYNKTHHKNRTTKTWPTIYLWRNKYRKILVLFSFEKIGCKIFSASNIINPLQSITSLYVIRNNLCGEKVKMWISRKYNGGCQLPLSKYLLLFMLHSCISQTLHIPLVIINKY
jgi:hypothetical protein